MYSMVLMMALTTGGVSEPVTFGGNGCHGGCYGGCVGNGHGCHGGFLFGGRGCHGGCNGGCHGGFLFGGRGCHGGGYGCNGGCHGGFLFGGRHGGCHGGCYGGCHGGMPVEPVPVKPGEKPMETSNQAILIVNIPTGSKLTIDNTPTVSTSNVRTFVSPTLEPGKEYIYTLKAEIVNNGRTETVTKEVTVQANQTTRVTIEAPVVSTTANK